MFFLSLSLAVIERICRIASRVLRAVTTVSSTKFTSHPPADLGYVRAPSRTLTLQRYPRSTHCKSGVFALHSSADSLCEIDNRGWSSSLTHHSAAQSALSGGVHRPPRFSPCS